MITKNQLKAKSLQNMSSYDEDDYLIEYCKDNNIPLYKEWGEDLRIELHDNRTMWKIENKETEETEEFFWGYYNDILQIYIENFEAETGVVVYFQGRSGRHCTIELNKYNLLHYEELKEKALQYEKDFIKEINEQ